jgi:hypothetical protein
LTSEPPPTIILKEISFMLRNALAGACCAGILLSFGVLFAQQPSSLPASTPAPTCHAMVPGENGSMGGYVPFTPASLWNQKIASAPVDPNSTAIIGFIGTSTPLHPDFGSGTYDGQSIGIPYLVVAPGHGAAAITYTDSPDESDPGPMPIPINAPIEGYPNPGSGDRHVLVLDQGNCWLYELYSSYPNANGTWKAGSGAAWDLENNEQRPWGWTSADAAGLPIFAGLVRYDEILNGSINHALRFTLQDSRQAFTPPASHWAANSTNPLAAPMGMRVRLKASVDISGFSATNQIILTAMKNYGMIMADNGSSMFLSGDTDSRWNNDDLHNLTSLTASDFEVVKMSPVYTTIPTGPAPVITSFKASSYSAPKGALITLTWATTGATYYNLNPGVAMLRGTTKSLVINLSRTITFVLTATGPYGSTTSTLTVTAE